MLDIAIVGAGLCGLAIAKDLQRQGRDFALFEARSRVGGRVLSEAASAKSADPGKRVDLGPTWFWPQTNPLFAQLLEELKLASHAQYDSGDVLLLKEVDKTPEAQASNDLHEGARRVAGGVAGVTDALAALLPAESLHLDHVLAGVVRHEDHIELRFLRGGGDAPDSHPDGSDGIGKGDQGVTVLARHVVLAVPPRLIAEQVRFEPALDAGLVSAMQATQTWMAAQAKAVLFYDRPLWREAGRSGSAFVVHEQAVFREIFDACDASGDAAALGGFVALSPELRHSFRVGLPMLMGNQMMQVFGKELGELPAAMVYCDWAAEPYTCSRLDVAEFGSDAGHPAYGNPILRQPAWDQNLHFAGSETAAYAGGYLEGALDAARRVLRDLAILDASSTNAAALAAFRAWIRERRRFAFEEYRRHLNQSLAAQQREQLTQRAALAAIEGVFGDALAQIRALPFDGTDVPVERGRSDLTPLVQSAFGDFIGKLMEDIASFNSTSCALSNLPDEHRPSRDYQQTILRDIAAAWREFSLDANALLIARRSATVHAFTLPQAREPA